MEVEGEEGREGEVGRGEVDWKREEEIERKVEIGREKGSKWMGR